MIRTLITVNTPDRYLKLAATQRTEHHVGLFDRFKKKPKSGDSPAISERQLDSDMLLSQNR